MAEHITRDRLSLIRVFRRVDRRQKVSQAASHRHQVVRLLSSAMLHQPGLVGLTSRWQATLVRRRSYATTSFDDRCAGRIRSRISPTEPGLVSDRRLDLKGNGLGVWCASLRRAVAEWIPAGRIGSFTEISMQRSPVSSPARRSQEVARTFAKWDLPEPKSQTPIYPSSRGLHHGAGSRSPE
jgi:hypothetical protein